MDVYKDPERLMAERKAGPPDLRKPFVRERTGKAKKPKEEEQPLDEPTGIDDDLDDILNEPDQSQQQPPPQYIPPEPAYQQPPPPLYQQPPAAQEQYISQQISELNATKQNLEYQIGNLVKLLGVFKKYLVYHRQLIKDTESVIEEVAEVSSGVRAGAGAAPTPAPRPLPTLLDEQNGKRKKRITILMSGLGLVFILGAFYMGAIVAGLPITGVIAFIVAGIGGGLVAVGIRG